MRRGRRGHRQDDRARVAAIVELLRTGPSDGGRDRGDHVHRGGSRGDRRARAPGARGRARRTQPTSRNERATARRARRACTARDSRRSTRSPRTCCASGRSRRASTRSSRCWTTLGARLGFDDAYDDWLAELLSEERACGRDARSTRASTSKQIRTARRAGPARTATLLPLDFRQSLPADIDGFVAQARGRRSRRAATADATCAAGTLNGIGRLSSAQLAFADRLRERGEDDRELARRARSCSTRPIVKPTAGSAARLGRRRTTAGD